MANSSDPRIQEALSLHQSGRFDAAIQTYESILAESPQHAEALHLLGLAQHQTGNDTRAATLLAKAVELNPQDPGYRYNLGVVLQKLGKNEEAEAAYRQVISQDAASVSAWVNLGNLLGDMGKFGDSCDCHRNALRIQPDEAEHHLRLARSLRLMGEIETAMSHLGIAASLKPESNAVHSALLFTSQYEPGINLPELERRHEAWAARIPKPDISGDSGISIAEPPFRVGFLSPDFGNHPVGIFAAPLLERLQKRTDIETICFNDRHTTDEFTKRNQQAANRWIEVASHSDDQLYDAIAAEKLDVLIELTGHTDNNRLAVMARRPASIQVTWAGYVGTTGLEAIDYLITDAFHCPDGSEQYYAETLLRFPNDYISWEPPSYAPEPGPAPLTMNGHPTFGCLNNPSKLTTPTLKLWSSLMRSVPNARLFLKYKGMDDPAVRRRVLGIFAVHGVAPERIDMVGQTTHGDHLAAFQMVDVALDPMPYSGGISTCEALWMGVPVVTLPGDTFASRHSLSHLSNAGLEDTVATTPMEYVSKAIELVSDPYTLSERRESMRKKMAVSPLCDLDGYAEDFASAIRVISGAS